MNNKGFKYQLGTLKRKLADRRLGKERSGSETITYLAVAHCSKDPSRPLQKYAHVTALETVETNNISLEGIKQACAAFFHQEGKECIVMVNDKGTTVKHISQMNIKKPFCCRFIELGGSLPATLQQRKWWKQNK